MAAKALWMLVGVALFLVAITVLGGRNLAFVHQEELAPSRIYAYRDWQSTGVQLQRGDLVEIRATGRWLYTPDEYHGPAGHPIYPAPAVYPISGIPGGALIGRVGEDGAPFYVGSRARQTVQRDGLLFLRINDDVLTDNDGVVEVKITVVRHDEEMSAEGWMPDPMGDDYPRRRSAITAMTWSANIGVS